VELLRACVVDRKETASVQKLQYSESFLGVTCPAEAGTGAQHPKGESDELQKNEDNEADEGKGFGECDTEEHGGTHHAGGLWLTSHGLN